MKHTFMVLAYKESKYLSECIESLLSQSVKSNIVMTTSTPSDYLTDIANKYKIPLIVNGDNPGICSDWQFAVNSCETPYYTLAHQDDIYYKNYTETLLPHMEKSSIAFCNYEENVDGQIRSNTILLRIKRMLLFPFAFKKSLKSKFFKKQILKLGSPICCPSVMYNKDLCDGPVFNKEFKNNLDWYAWISLAKKRGAFSYSKKILMSHRIHEDSETTNQIATNGRSEEDLAMFEMLWPSFIAKKLHKMYTKSYDSNSQK